jgi:YD repeat-containing protein
VGASPQLSYGLQWDIGPRLTNKEDRNALPISSPVAFGSAGQTGANFREQTSYDVNLATPLLSSQASSDPVNIENSSFAYDTEYDLTGTSGFDPPDPWVAYTYGRDTGGRITSVARTFNQGIILGPAFGAVAGPGSTYAYYPNGYLQTRTDADGEHDYVYDARGLLETITIPGEGVYTFGYDQLGRNTQLTFPDGHVRVQQYDQEGRITSRCYEYTGSLETRCYTASYDPVGNPVTMTDPEGTDTLTYDALNRLMQVSRSTGGIEDYAFNTLGALSTTAAEARGRRQRR